MDHAYFPPHLRENSPTNQVKEVLTPFGVVTEQLAPDQSTHRGHISMISALIPFIRTTLHYFKKCTVIDSIELLCIHPRWRIDGKYGWSKDKRQERHGPSCQSILLETGLSCRNDDDTPRQDICPYPVSISFTNIYRYAFAECAECNVKLCKTYHNAGNSDRRGGTGHNHRNRYGTPTATFFII